MKFPHMGVSKTTKLESRSQVCLFVGYPKETRGGLFYNPEENKVFVSKNATFLEEDYMREFKPHSRVVPEELLAGSTSTPPSIEVDKDVAPSVSERRMQTHQDNLPPRRSGSVLREPNRYLGF